MFLGVCHTVSNLCLEKKENKKKKGSWCMNRGSVKRTLTIMNGPINLSWGSRAKRNCCWAPAVPHLSPSVYFMCHLSPPSSHQVQCTKRAQSQGHEISLKCWTRLSWYCTFVLTNLQFIILPNTNGQAVKTGHVVDQCYATKWKQSHCIHMLQSDHQRCACCFEHIKDTDQT